jgi:Na+-translocating ferredoxin:NAD+ oxidoreductase subunit E
MSNKAKKTNIWTNFIKGIFKENPIFVSALGLCPTLAVTTSLDNAIGMGISVIFVMIFSALFVSSIRKVTPSNVRIPVFIVIIATFVTIIQLILKGFFPSLDQSLGIFIPLIVVNCIILGKAESFASKNNIFSSIIDSLGAGVGFTLALVLIGSIRELIGTGILTFFGKIILSLGQSFQPISIAILAPGALLTMGLLLALINSLSGIDFKKQMKHVESHNGDVVNKVSVSDSSNNRGRN